MAVKAVVATDISRPGTPRGDALLVTWAAAAAADTFQPIALPGYRCVGVQVAGTMGSAAITMTGSIDGTTFYALNDPAGAAFSLSALGLGYLNNAGNEVAYYKPVTAGGGGSSAVVVSALFVRS